MPSKRHLRQQKRALRKRCNKSPHYLTEGLAKKVADNIAGPFVARKCRFCKGGWTVVRENNQPVRKIRIQMRVFQPQARTA